MKIKKNIAISESGFLLNTTTGESFSLNPIGVEIINLIKENKSYDEISEEILSKYEIDNSTFEKDYNDYHKMLEFYHLTETEN